ncbi:amino acid ABC transporter ATP-binding/permease protein [Moraxella cuniculi]|uniref:Probable ABC transporter ATP-binding protein HI_0664 n=1 Tax=Moraxella cuniculi TaxID=34061 RepID=A0A3S4RL76_9GAMM|nr:ATP-binding cassette domain-containing protein [Moraxella cuniculi]VEG13304.1 Probable ABC transporter ATP-binding protein HI_0664 [Moraxella cuniculi]
MKKRPPFLLRTLIADQCWMWAVSWLLGLLTVWSVLGLSMVSGWFVTMSAVSGLLLVGNHAFNYMMPAAIIRMFAIIRTLSRYGDLMVAHHAVFGLLKSLRMKFFRTWANLPLSLRSLQGHSSSQKMHRLVKDIDILNEFILKFISPWVMTIGAVAMVAVVVWWFLPTLWWVLLVIVVSMLVAVVAIKLSMALARQENHLSEQRKTKLLDTLPALTSLLIWQKWDDQIAHIQQLDDDYAALMLKTHKLRRLSMLLIGLYMMVAVLLLLWGLGQQLFTMPAVPFALDTLNDYGKFSPAIALAILLGFFGLAEFIQNLVAEPLALGRSQMARDNLNQLLVEQPQATRTPVQMLGITRPTMILKNATVKTPKAIMATSNLNAVIGCDKPCLVIGASGAGKSTLLQTLAGEYPLIAGEMIFQGELGKSDWQSVEFGGQLGFLGQTVDIFDQTLADNLRLGKPCASDDELYAVLDKVGLLPWLHAQPQGLATRLGEYGMAISGGQARRIALARLLLAPKAVLLLDEPFAGLDSATRQVVWESLLLAQKSGDIGLLLIATHQRWQQMGDVSILTVGD